MLVQVELARRANLRSSKNGVKRIYISKYTLSSIVFCRECVEIYRRVHWNSCGKKSIVWRCASKLEEKGSDCGSPTVSEEDLQKAVLKAINCITARRDDFIKTHCRNIETA